MTITKPFVLPSDIVITPVAQLEPQLRAQLVYDADDYAIGRPRSRTTAKIVNTEMAELLRTFEQPRTIVEAVISFSHQRQVDPEQMLIDIFPFIEQFIQFGFLVPSADETARPIQPSLAPGDTFADCTVLTCVQALADSEIYQARRQQEIVALKIARHGGGDLIQQMIAHEAAILAKLDGIGTPRLLATGDYAGRAYLVMQWCPGIPILDAAADLRDTSQKTARSALIALALALLDAYAALHARGVIHADIHPRNALVDRNGCITLIDFGIAWAEVTALRAPPRAGVGFYFEPEYAQAMRTKRDVIQASTAGEQYALAALVYQILTNATYLEFSLERDEMLRQIAEEPPLPFAKRGVDPWPKVEATLARALSKQPADRFPSVGAFAQALREASVVSANCGDDKFQQLTTMEPVAPDLVEEVLRLISPSGAWYESTLTDAPTASVNFGAAGIACALLHLACLHSDPALLALADVWIGRAERAAKQPGAFFNAEAGLDPATIGPVSTFHTATGIACIRAQIASAMGDTFTHELAIKSFLTTAQKPCTVLDLTLGRSGTVLAAAALLDTLLPIQEATHDALVDFGARTLADIWHLLDQHDSITADNTLDNLGIAHGWGGMTYAALRWCQVTGASVPAKVWQRLQELAALAEPFSRGVRWSWLRQQSGQASTYMAGWCNGNAGYVHLWTLAHKLRGEADYLTLAEQAAWGAWEQPSTVGNLCCGLAGQAYALLALYQHTGEDAWLQRARKLAAQSASQMRPLLAKPNNEIPLDLRPQSLYKGVVGVASLLADLEQPDRGRQPFFAREC